ncbi:hypothetical protein Q1695_000219 [Nippostrongylus brasiliensis]|nr:hypothetical protein Q1695_000219 [Nippostrongylus brasiliensis]
MKGDQPDRQYCTCTDLNKFRGVVQKHFLIYCIANCPPIYRDNCYGTVKMICATGVQANSMVTTTGTECRQTWTCPAGTQPYYYDYSSIPIDYPPGGYAQCYPPPRNNWYLPDGITQIQAVSCESPT